MNIFHIRPAWNGAYFADSIFKCVFMKGFLKILTEISLNVALRCPIDKNGPSNGFKTNWWQASCRPRMIEFNTLRQRQNGRHFPDDIFKCFFLNENVLILLNISLAFVPKVRINNIPALVRIMAWRRPGEKPLRVTPPQWVNCITRPHLVIERVKNSSLKLMCFPCEFIFTTRFQDWYLLIKLISIFFIGKTCKI